eukprot:3179086-Prymnesium_polylepis.1
MAAALGGGDLHRAGARGAQLRDQLDHQVVRRHAHQAVESGRAREAKGHRARARRAQAESAGT